MMHNDIVKYVSRSGLRFTWDKAKKAKNLKDHKIDFEVATEVFDDPNLTFKDSYFVDGEERHNVLGRTIKKGHVLLVVLTERTFEGLRVIRIISARRAEKGDCRDQRV